MDPQRVQAVYDWETPKCVQELQCFLGFANFYRRFIEGYFRVRQPMFNLLKKEKEWAWSEERQRVFDQLKERYYTAPILKHFDPNLETILETDASDYIVLGILSQKYLENDKLVLHPVAYLSEKMSSAECNYGIGNKELLAIVACLKKWHIYLHALSKVFTIYMDHHNLQTFSTKALLNRRPARLARTLAQHDFAIAFRPGIRNRKADALTRRSGDLSKEGDERARPVRALIPKEKFTSQPILYNTAIRSNTEIRQLLTSDKLGKEIILPLKQGDKQYPKVPLGECIIKNELIYIFGLLYVPENEELEREIIHIHHDRPAAGHPEQAATYKFISRNYWWPNMRKVVARYLSNCDTCEELNLFDTNRMDN